MFCIKYEKLDAIFICIFIYIRNLGKYIIRVMEALIYGQCMQT